MAAGWDSPLAGDEVQYEQLAENVALGRGFFTDKNPFFPGERLYAWQAPLYPYMLATLYVLAGPSPVAARALQVLLGVMTVWLVHDLARRAWPGSGDRGTAQWAAVLVALYPGLITNTHLLLSETLFTLLLLLSFDLLARTRASRRQSWWAAAAAGMAFGLATLTRGTSLYFAPLAAVWLALPGDTLRAWLRPLRWGPALLFLMACGLTLAPWALRNAGVFGQFELLESKGGVNFWLGNSPDTPSNWIRNVWKVGVREPILAQLPAGEVARDRAGYALALDYIRQEPLVFVARMPVKLADFWGFERNLMDVAEATRGGAPGGWTNPGKVVADSVAAVGYILLMLAAVAGLFWGPDDRTKLLIAGLVVYMIALHAVVFGDGRFHLPLIPFLALYGGWMVAHRAHLRINRAGWRMRGVALVMAALVFIWTRECVAAYMLLGI